MDLFFFSFGSIPKIHSLSKEKKIFFSIDSLFLKVISNDEFFQEQ